MASSTNDADESARRLGSEIRLQRVRLGLDQRSLALVSGVSRSSVVAAEAGKATLRLDVLVRICRALGLRVAVVPDQSGAGD